MSCENKDRKRNRILNFRVSEEELRLIDAKVAVSGLAKGDYFIRMLYGETIVIRAGKYQSDRLAVELKNSEQHWRRYWIWKKYVTQLKGAVLLWKK